MGTAAPTGDLDALREEWDDLADRSGAPIFARPGWFRTWWQTFGSGTVKLETVRRDGRLVGVAPLQWRAGAHESMTNWHTPEFPLVAEDGDARAELARTIFAAQPRRVSFSFLTADGPDLPVLTRAASSARYTVIARTLERSPYLPLEGDWESYQGTRDRRLVSEARRRRRRLEEQGEVSFELADGTERLESVLDEGFRIEASGWKAEQGTAIISRPETRRFYTELARWAAQRGALRLAFLRLDGRPLAFQYILEDGDVIYFLKGGYDPEFSKLAPGTLLMEEILSYAFGRGLRTYEFLGSEEPFKLEWTDRVRDRKLVQAFAPTLTGVVDWAAWAFGRPLAKRALALRHRIR